MKKDNDLFISAIIVAAGKGSRMNMNINKQYVDVCGKPILARTLQVFQDCNYINEIVLVVNIQDLIYCKQNIIDFYGFDKVKTIVKGGAERQNSVYNGLLEVNKRCDMVLIHDGARPFIEEEDIIECISAACEYSAASVAVPVKDTIKAVDKENFVKETLDRSTLWAIQTPQVFKFNLILSAHTQAIQDGFVGTDDAVLVEKLGFRMKLVMGSYDNIKITTQEDLLIAEAIVNNSQD